MKKIAKLYTWELNNELYASIYFSTMLGIYSIEVLLHGEKSVEILIMLEMMIVCYIIALLQRKVFSDGSSYSGKSQIIRTLLWYGFSISLVIVSCFVFNWFEHLQSWAMGVFIANMVLCFILLWIGINIVNKIDTKHLNDLLSRYQENIKNNEKESELWTTLLK